MELRGTEIARIIDGNFHGKDAMIRHICVNSKLCGRDSLFFALKGKRTDGHLYIEDAKTHGSLGAVVEKKVKELKKFFIIEVKDTLSSLKKLGAFVRDRVDNVIGITGSAGKTTTKEMIFSVLSSTIKTLKTVGNYNTEIGIPISIFEYSNEKIFVSEISAQTSEEIEEILKMVRPDIGVVTNIGYSHTEFHKDIDGVFKAKSKLVLSLPENGVLFLNADDPNVLKMKDIRKIKTITYGIKKGDITAEDIEMDIEETRFRCEGEQFKLKTFGYPFIYSSLAAISVGLEFGIPIERIKESLKNFSPMWGRMEVENKNGVIFIKDYYNSNPSSVKELISSIDRIRGGRRVIYVLGDMLELGEREEVLHREIGKLINLKEDDLVLTFGNLSRYISEEVEKRGLSSKHFNSKDNLRKFLLETIKEGDIVAIKGSRGMRMEEILC